MNLPTPRRVDAACALALLILTAALARWAHDQARQSGLRPAFYQAEFAPAVMFACGQGLHNLDWSNEQALSAFLLQTRDTLACGEVRPGLDHIWLNNLQAISLYLEYAVGLTWRLAGVSWDAVSWLSALLAGLFGAMVYGVMRLGMRPFTAAIFSAAVVTSPLHLSYVPQLRDYSKAPFLLALLLLMGLAVKRALSWRPLLGLSALGGFVAGVGFGFRTDILLAAVPFMAALLIFRGSPSMLTRLMQGAAASVVFMASFAVTAAPVLSGYARGGNSGHVILLGFTNGFSFQLGVEAKHYELSALYDDAYQEAIVRSYASRVKGDAQVFSIGTEKYDRESGRYLTSVILTFPADIAIRAFSAVARILNAPFTPRYAHVTGWVHSPFVRRMYDRRAEALQRVGWLGWTASALVIAGVAARSARLATFLVFIAVFFGGAAAIQFDARHFFYLEFMAWWAVGVMVDRAAAAGPAIPAVTRESDWCTREGLARVGLGAARSAAVVVACVLAATVLLRATRHYQQHNMNQLFERVLAAAGQPLSVATVPNGESRVTMIVDLPELELSRASWQTRSIGTAYLLIDVNPQRCDAWNFSLLARHEALQGTSDFTTPVAVPLPDPHPGSSVKILIPVYAVWYGGDLRARFTGIELARRHAPCIASISKVSDLGSFPVLVTAILGSDWRTASHYQTMIGLETREDGAAFDVRLYPTLATLDLGRSVLSQPAAEIERDVVVVSRVAALVPPVGATVHGTPETPYAYLLQWRQRTLSRGTCAVAEGELAAGGLTFGILQNNQWYQQVNILDRGRFIAAGCTQEDGHFSMVLANNNPAGSVTTARLTKIGWVGAAP